MVMEKSESRPHLFHQLESFGFKNLAVTDSKKHLRKLLADNWRGGIVLLVNSLDDIPAEVDKRSNIYVLIDEAERATRNGVTGFLFCALPNATFLGFTGAPASRTQHDGNLTRFFGKDDLGGYLDSYSAQESVTDGVTVPTYHTAGPKELQLDLETLDREFLSVDTLAGVCDFEELDEFLQHSCSLPSELKNPERIDQAAHYIADHFRANVELAHQKAILVACDPEACHLYHKALSNYLPADYCDVIAPRPKAGSTANSGSPTTDEDTALHSSFRDPRRRPNILITSAELLSGFDVPPVGCMYLDKPLRDHVLWRTIARLNRPFSYGGRRKTASTLVDMVGLFERVDRALDFQSEDRSGLIESIDVLRHQFASQIARAREDHLSWVSGGNGKESIEAAIRHLAARPTRRVFYSLFQELEDKYEILAPDDRLQPFVYDYVQLVSMYQICWVRFAHEPDTRANLLPKTAALLEEQTKLGLHLVDPNLEAGAQQWPSRSEGSA